MKANFHYMAGVKWLAAIVVAQWLQVPNIMRALIVLMAIDYLTGFIAAIRKKSVSSEIGWWGLVRKLVTLILLLACHLIEATLGAEWRIEQIAAIGYCINETISVIENCSRIGVPIPAQLVSALSTVKHLRGREATAEQLRDLEREERESA